MRCADDAPALRLFCHNFRSSIVRNQPHPMPVDNLDLHHNCVIPLHHPGLRRREAAPVAGCAHSRANSIHMHAFRTRARFRSGHWRDECMRRCAAKSATRGSPTAQCISSHFIATIAIEYNTRRDCGRASHAECKRSMSPLLSPPHPHPLHFSLCR